MKAAVLFGKRDVRITDFPEPPMNENNVKIKVEYCGLCGTDLHKFEGMAGSRPVVYPVPLGHEASGIVVEVGKNVIGFTPGDRVTVDPNWYCGHCDNCKKGLTHLCTSSKGVVKGMAEYICPPYQNVYRIPDGLSLREAALAEPLSCCLRGLDRLGTHPGEKVALIGMGAIGTMMLQLLLRVYGAEVAVIEYREDKRGLAMKLGAERFICSATDDVDACLEGFVPDRVIECVGLPATAEMAVHIAGRGATVVLFGVSAVDAGARMPLYEMFLKELTVKTSYINPGTTGRAISILASGILDTSLLISREISLDELPCELAERRYCKNGKVIVKIN